MGVAVLEEGGLGGVAGELGLIDLLHGLGGSRLCF